LAILTAGVLWSLSGAFTKALSEPTPLLLHDPPVGSIQIAFYRALFAGLALAPTLIGRRPPAFGKALPLMVGCFAAMNVLFITAMTAGPAAGAILLQYSAPAWVALAGWYWLREPIGRGEIVLLAGGLSGVAVLVAGNWGQTPLLAVAAGLGSGLTYAGVLLCLRALRDRPANWLTAVNLAGSALLLMPIAVNLPTPRPMQLAWLALFGVVQLALPYVLMARGLHSVTAVEAGILTLVEPVLNPVWAYLVSPGTERPSTATMVGGCLILGALAVRYLPLQRQRSVQPDATN
jgi:drug/metabolite transporter (DMT)-like permease